MKKVGFYTKKAIFDIQKQANKKVLFTEFGYRSKDYNGKKPWDFSKLEGDVNLAAQTDGLQAIYNQFWSEDWFAGGFLWKWFLHHDRVGGLQNDLFTPQNKPAEILISKLYGKQN